MKCTEETLEPISKLALLNPDTYSIKEQWPLIQYLDTGSITQGNMNGYQIIRLDIDELPGRARRKVRAGDIVYSTVRPNQGHYGILLNPEDNMLVSTGFTVIRATDNRICPEVLYLFLTQDKLTKGLQQIAEQSVSAYPSIKADDLGALEMPVPTAEEAAELHGSLQSLFEYMETGTRKHTTDQSS